MEGEDRRDLQRKKGMFGMFEGVWVEEKQETPRKGGEKPTKTFIQEAGHKEAILEGGEMVIHARA
jgi:hypothetical protein